jgi:ribulose-phosphate 3-epimerase
MREDKKCFVASVISMDLREFFLQIDAIENSAVHGYHFDVMDGNFVPRLGLPPEYLEAIRSISDLSVEVHIMVDAPERYFELFLESGGNSIIPHFESMKDPKTSLNLMNSLGIERRIAINPSTPLEVLDPLLDDIDFITLMAINPGIKGSKLIESTFSRLSTLNAMIAKIGKKIGIEIDGGVTFENARKLYGENANTLVCGAGTIFSPSDSITENLKRMDRILAESQNVY